jgi:hypothetical protein
VLIANSPSLRSAPPGTAFATFERLKRISDFLANFDFSYVQSLYREINKYSLSVYTDFLILFIREVILV